MITTARKSGYKRGKGSGDGGRLSGFFVLELAVSPSCLLPSLLVLDDDANAMPGRSQSRFTCWHSYRSHLHGSGYERRPLTACT